MIKREAIIATTHLDSEGDRLTVGALQSLVDSIYAAYIPIWNEHDPRNPPMGRIASAEIRKRSDGEHEVAAILELFDGSESDQCDSDRELIREDHSEDQSLKVVPDRSFRSPEDMEDLRQLSQLLGTKSVEAVKKSMEPLAVLQLSAAFVAGGIAAGFFSKLGSDAADFLKDKLKRLMGRKEQSNSDRVIRFVFQIEKDTQSIEVDAFITNPTDDDIDEIIDQGLTQLDHIVPGLMNPEMQLGKLTFEYKDGQFELKFGVRKDCVPVTLMVEKGEHGSDGP